MRKTLFPVLLVASGCLGAQPVVQVTTALDYDDNWNFASRSDEKKDDVAGSLQAVLGWSFALPDDSTLSLAGTAKAQYFDRYDDLDHTDAGVSATYSRKLGLGGEVPRVWLSTAASHAHYKGSVRTGWLYDTTAGIDKWCGERWQLQATYNYFRRNANAGEEAPPGFSAQVFDQQAWTVGVSATYLFSDSTAGIFGYARRDGDITATTRPGRDVWLASDAIAEDEAFGDEYYAYRLPAVAHDFYLELSQGIGAHNSINLRYQYRTADGRGGFDYENNMARLSWVYAY
jgi:hypothetical protein